VVPPEGAGAPSDSPLFELIVEEDLLRK
jgi:hypothetical protein